ncbi:hypothetical protein [Haloferula sargassicola]|uniref:DUF4178 domain-containing protein n=1 Tax=Haloferula sargassicola TaxID=490096 RepID=A0ABP9UXQ5_9BACT
MQGSSTTRRWNAFVCPECRQVFRVPGDHEGQGVVCPGCHRMLKLPAPEDVVPPLVIGAEHGRMAIADPQRVHHSGRRADEFDETFSKRGPTDTLVKRLVIAGATTMVMALLVGLMWSRGGRGVEKSQAFRPPTTEVAPEPAGEAAEAEASGMPKVAIEELEPAIHGAFDQPEGDERLAWMLHPDLTKPRLERPQAGETRPGALRQIFWNIPFAAAGDRVGVAIQDKDFSTYCVWLAKEDAGWKVDWESTVGWSPFSMEDLATKKPARPVQMRVRSFPAAYYNFSFSDEDLWRCFRLETPDGEAYIYGYAAAGSPAARTLASLPAERNATTVEVRFPANSQSDRQVIIERVISESWVAPETDS